MITIVTGHPRSGTTMAMRCIDAGGIPSHVSDERADYMEPSEEDIARLLQSPREFDGKSIKVVYPKRLLMLEPFDYRIIVMHRDSAEINASFKKETSTTVKIDKLWQEGMQSICRILGIRNDVDLHNFHYREILESPVEQLSKLSHCIDVDKAVAVIDQSKCNWKKEDMAVEEDDETEVPTPWIPVNPIDQ